MAGMSGIKSTRARISRTDIYIYIAHFLEQYISEYALRVFFYIVGIFNNEITKILITGEMSAAGITGIIILNIL